MALLDEFRETPHCVLFATSSFWQGVDVPGEQLSCVIIDKLPFAVPNDPGGRSPHPQCARGRGQSFLRLPDSAGRHRAEAGVRPPDPHAVRPRSARLLDNRITQQRYGQVFFDSLPGLRIYHAVWGRGEVFRCLKFRWNILSRRDTRSAQLPGQVRERARPQLPRAGYGARRKARPTGMLADFVELKRLLRAISEPLDHVFLNDIEPFTDGESDG
jgi:hypothetical protein